MEKVYYIEGIYISTNIEHYIRLKKLDKTIKESDLNSMFYQYLTNGELNPNATPMEIVLKLWRELEPYTIEEIKTIFGKYSKIFKWALKAVQK